ncbi:MAG: HAMP domain-containing protein [Endomicrobiales bacterium]|nr:HAMP domain-containing protein [Endomicrobiales bacterium]
MWRTIFSKIFSANAVILVIFSILILFSSFEVIRQQYISTLTRSLASIADVSLYAIKPPLKKHNYKKLKPIIKDISEKTNTRLTIISPDGTVVADSEEEAEHMDNHGNRPEVKEAFSGKERSTSIRYSSTLEKEMLYLAIPIDDGKNIYGVLRASIFLKDIGDLTAVLKGNMIRLTFFFIIMALLGSYFFAKGISDPVRELSLIAEKVGSGDFNAKIHIKNSDELKQLGDSFNNMTEKVGALFKELKHMEAVRKDFVTNVSHELRTPLTAIKGFTETLKQTVKSSKPAARKESARYVDIILKHSERLINIVNDLLVLSNLESRKFKIELTEVNIINLINDVIKLFDDRIKQKKLKLRLSKTGSLKPIQADSFRLEQVFVNLIDNAIKYTEKGSISIEVNQDETNTIIDIKDTGIGIPKEHLNRIFERFYVADKSRSKKFGGTGLGLSIVKHIIQLHQGTIDVESRQGTGTGFRIILPLQLS